MIRAVPMAKDETSNTIIAPSAPPIPVTPKANAPVALEPIHDVCHQIHLLREALRSEKRRLGFFLGAGCPLGIYDAVGTKSIKHIPDVAGLTTSIETFLIGETAFKECWTKLTTACKSETIPLPNVEHILTQLRTICALKGSTSVDGMTADSLIKLDTRICELIASSVGKPLPKYPNAYHRFASWIGHIDRVNPIEVFTPNYDLLFEESLEEYKVPFFDGFVGAREPFFDLAAMEQDAVPPRWTRLWKLHGSINWIKRDDESVFRSFPAEIGQQLLIYPSHLKYEQSRRMPYLAMIDRLRAFFRDTNSVLIVCGYSFADDHLNEVILDGLRGNRSAQCFALMYQCFKDCGSVTSHARKHSNLTVLTWDGGVIGTRPGGYKRVDRSSVVIGGGFDVPSSSTGPPNEKTALAQCQLGDFHHFALFLETQFGVKIADQSSEKAS